MHKASLLTLAMWNACLKPQKSVQCIIEGSRTSDLPHKLKMGNCLKYPKKYSNQYGGNRYSSRRTSRTRVVVSQQSRTRRTGTAHEVRVFWRRFQFRYGRIPNHRSDTAWLAMIKHSCSGPGCHCCSHLFWSRLVK